MKIHGTQQQRETEGLPSVHLYALCILEVELEVPRIFEREMEIVKNNIIGFSMYFIVLTYIVIGQGFMRHAFYKTEVLE